jgi:YHS domain-containing protein
MPKQATAPAQKTCPVLGNPIDTAIHVDYQGKRIYFCCNACPAEFSKDPQKYLKALADRGESVQIVDSAKAGLKAAAPASAKSSAAAQKLAPQKTCPIMGGAIDKNLYLDFKGKRIYVCCGGCIDAVKKDPEAALKKLAELGEYAVNVPGK